MQGRSKKKKDQRGETGERAGLDTDRTPSHNNRREQLKCIPANLQVFCGVMPHLPVPLLVFIVVQGQQLLKFSMFTVSIQGMFHQFTSYERPTLACI